jgi:hypothetical protein
VGGQYLDGVTNVYLSGSGARGVVLEHVKPLTPQQANALREKLKELQDKRAATRIGPNRRPDSESPASTNVTWTTEDERLLREIREKLAAFQRRPMNPAVAETVTVRIKLASDAEPTDREIRLGTPQGLSNPLAFWVGQLPEFREPAEVDRNEPRPGLEPRRAPTPPSPSTESVMRITLPAVVNGQILPGDVDRYRFAARRGQSLVVIAQARELIPYLPDAVPGWFQATLAVFDAQGHELAYADDYRFHPDPVLHYVIPKDGDYLVEIKDAVYRGREDFVYRVALGELPFATSIFPLGGPADVPTRVEIRGWNLPLTDLVQKPEPNTPGIHPLPLPPGQRPLNRLAFAVGTLPEILEREPNDRLGGAQRIAPPVIVNGRIDPPGDTDIFRFEGRAGDELVAEVQARRLDSPLDSVLRLSDSSGRQLALNDDHVDKGDGLTTHHADARLALKLPADGAYELHLGDTQHKGGPDYAYRLRLSPPRSDFELRIVPSSISLRAGATVPLTIYALRKDGCTNEIRLTLTNAPPGFKLQSARVPANQDQVRLTLTAPTTPTSELTQIGIEGRATIQGQEITRAAVPAEDVMQGFIYRHLVPAKELLVAVTGQGRARAPLEILSDAPVRIPVGGTAEVQVRGPRGALLDRLQLELDAPPPGVAIRRVSPQQGGLVIVLAAEAAKAQLGLEGNLIVNAHQERPAGATNAPPRAPRRFLVGTLPAIPFAIVPAHDTQ